MLQRNMARHHGSSGGGARKAPPLLLLWWSGTTATWMFVIFLRTRLAVVSRYQPNNTITLFSSSAGDMMIGTDDFVHSNSNRNNNNNKNQSTLVQHLSSTRETSFRSRSKTIDHDASKRPNSGRFANAWNFTAQEQHVVAPMASVFGSAWDELHGKKCQQTTYDNLPALQDYISSLDLYIVSHGGLGSNALIDHLDIHTPLKVKQQQHDTDNDTDPLLYYASCHLGNPAFVALVRDLQQQQQDLDDASTRRMPPTLVIIGDFWNAFQSMKRRTWLNMNIAKNVYGSQACRSKWENSLAIFPNDPAGIKMMMLAHIIAAQQQQQLQQEASNAAVVSPIVFLQASYTRESILQALQLLLLPATGSTQDDNTLSDSASSIERHLEGFEVRQRATTYKTVAETRQVAAVSSTSGNSSPTTTSTGQVVAVAVAVDPLLELYQPYEALEDILTRMPRAWKAADTPRELLDYLLEEFQ